VELIGNPERYHDRQVVVRGYLSVESENDSLFLHREDYENHLVKNAVALSASSYPDIAKFANRYVTVVGTFEAVPRDERFAWAGRITKIKRVE
jgi:hypothetical protein